MNVSCDDRPNCSADRPCLLANQHGHVFAFKRSWNDRGKLHSIRCNALDVELIDHVQDLFSRANNSDLGFIGMRLVTKRTLQQFVELCGHNIFPR